jgi:hypothetical protein
MKTLKIAFLSAALCLSATLFLSAQQSACESCHEANHSNNEWASALELDSSLIQDGAAKNMIQSMTRMIQQNLYTSEVEVMLNQMTRAAQQQVKNSGDTASAF